jgi:hypothetical protein
MTTDPTALPRPASRAASQPRAVASMPENLGFVATVVAGPAPVRPAIGAVAASVKALPPRPLGGARAASSAARG